MSSSQASLFDANLTDFDKSIVRCMNMLKTCPHFKIMRTSDACVYASPTGFDYTAGDYRIYARFPKMNDGIITFMDGTNAWEFEYSFHTVWYRSTDAKRADITIPVEDFERIAIFNHEMKNDFSIPFDKDAFFDLLDFGKWLHPK